MKSAAIVGLLSMTTFGAAGAAAQEPPKPQKEHEWLSQLVGEWDTEGEMRGEPGKPPMKTKGTESGRKIGEFWVQLEYKGEFMGAPFTGVLTLGYSPDKKKYIATWIDSISHHLWQYEGSVDASGRILTLETEGPCYPGKTARFREFFEIKSADQKIFTSTMENDGKWETVLTLNYRRKK